VLSRGGLAQKKQPGELVFFYTGTVGRDVMVHQPWLRGTHLPLKTSCQVAERGEALMEAPGEGDQEGLFRN